MVIGLTVILTVDILGLPNYALASSAHQPILQSPASSEAGVRAKALVRIIASGAARGYDQQARRLVNGLFAHLGEFDLPHLGITSASILQALDREDIGLRVGGVARVIWKDWSGIAQKRRLNVWTASPSNVGLSPFRQLVVLMIQGRQGTLRDNQQHAIHNLLTRSEEPQVWFTELDGVIAAINRESFLWP
jgi:hypothetical protein